MRIGNYHSDASFPSEEFLDGPTAQTNGITSDWDAYGALTHYGNGTGGQAQAHWDVRLEDYATSGLRVSDNDGFNCWFDMWVRSVGSTDFQRNVQSAGAGNRAGVDDSLRSVTIAAGTSLAVIATSDVIPPNSCAHFDVTIAVHRSDETAVNKAASWRYEGTLERSGTNAVVIRDGGTVPIYVYNGDAGEYATLALDVTTTGLTVKAPGHTTDDTTWIVRFEITKAQRAR